MVGQDKVERDGTGCAGQGKSCQVRAWHARSGQCGTGWRSTGELNADMVGMGGAVQGMVRLTGQAGQCVVGRVGRCRVWPAEWVIAGLVGVGRLGQDMAWLGNVGWCSPGHGGRASWVMQSGLGRAWLGRTG